MSASISCDKPMDPWSQQNEVKVEFTARKPNGEFQTLHLSQAEADGVGEVVVGAMSVEGRKRLLKKLRPSQSEADAVAECFVGAMSVPEREHLLIKCIQALTHAKLLRLLAFDLRERVRLPRKP